MTMEFKAANAGLLSGLKKGQAVAFEFVERQRGEYVVTSIGATRTGTAAQAAAMRAAPASGAASPSHSGH